MDTQRIGITWQVSDCHGWGIFGLNLARNLLDQGPCRPLMFTPPTFIDLDTAVQEKLAPCFREGIKLIGDHEETGVFLDKSVVLHSLNNVFRPTALSAKITGRANVGFVFFESADIQADARERVSRLDRLLVGSTWNLEMCQRAGMENVAFVSQGVDTDLFHPGPRQGVPSGRFVVYSGGKLEYRKGQDLVLEAFKRFQQKHPDSVLVTAWQNSWAETAETVVVSPFISQAPRKDEAGNLRIEPWAHAHGIPGECFVDLGWTANARLPAILREADVAVFPSRCEGGTNLCAMEAMACGVPTVLSANTRHLDLIEGDNCYPVTDQKPCFEGFDKTGEWQEVSVDGIVDCLERAYADREDCKRRGAEGAATLKNLSWRGQVPALVEAISDLL